MENPQGTEAVPSKIWRRLLQGLRPPSRSVDVNNRHSWSDPEFIGKYKTLDYVPVWMSGRETKLDVFNRIDEGGT